MEYRIDPELNEVLPKLSDADYKALEQSLLTEGYKGAPIMVWGDIIVDGHEIEYRLQGIKGESVNFSASDDFKSFWRYPVIYGNDFMQKILDKYN